MNLVKQFHFQTYFSFHEDISETKFYFYDTVDLKKSLKLLNLREDIRKSGTALFSGIDDPSDPNLGYFIEDGYGYFKIQERDDRTAGYWMTKNGIVERIVEFEVPGKLKTTNKEVVVDALFRNLIMDVS